MAPFPASKAFANGIDNIQNSSENTRVLKSKTLFKFFLKITGKLKVMQSIHHKEKVLF